jgi:hypothetical protein
MSRSASPQILRHKLHQALPKTSLPFEKFQNSPECSTKSRMARVDPGYSRLVAATEPHRLGLSLLPSPKNSARLERLFVLVPNACYQNSVPTMPQLVELRPWSVSRSLHPLK